MTTPQEVDKKRAELQVRYADMTVQGVVYPAPTFVGSRTGGFAIVYRGKWNRSSANDPPQWTEVASKVLFATGQNTTDAAERLGNLKRLERELSVWRTLRLNPHPNIQGLFGVEWHGDAYLPAMISPWRTHNLTDYLTGASREPRIAQIRLKLLKDVVEGLKHLHVLSIIHCDLNGNNVLVSSDNGGTVTALLCDFGLSWAAIKRSVTFSMNQHSKGTQGYAAPELGPFVKDPTQERPMVPYSYAADIWAFGSLFCHVFSGRTVSTDKDGNPIPEPALNRQYWDVVSKCCEPQPGERPSAAQVLSDVVLLN